MPLEWHASWSDVQVSEWAHAVVLRLPRITAVQLRELPVRLMDAVLATLKHSPCWRHDLHTDTFVRGKHTESRVIRFGGSVRRGRKGGAFRAANETP
jgi:hypothetical protein